MRWAGPGGGLNPMTNVLRRGSRRHGEQKAPEDRGGAWSDGPLSAGRTSQRGRRTALAEPGARQAMSTASDGVD